MRRTLSSPDFREGFVEMLPACLGLVPFGLVCGVGAAAAGIDFFGALGMSLIIFSGAAQILAVQLYADGAPLAVIIVTCLVAGLRFLMYSAAMAPDFRPLSARWQRGLAFLLTDQAFAASIRKFSARRPARRRAPFPGRRRRACGSCGSSTTPSVFAGNVIPAAWSLEFTVPLCFIALVAPALRDLPAIVAAVAAGSSCSRSRRCR